VIFHYWFGKAYEKMDWANRKIVGNQFIRSTDSVGEGYGRFHYLDKIKFYYNARASLKESRHWFELSLERGFIEKTEATKYLKIYAELSPKLNGFINSTYKKYKSDKSDTTG
jgi:four helix bundle protein